MIRAGSGVPVPLGEHPDKCRVEMADRGDKPFVDSQNQSDRPPRDAGDDVGTSHQHAPGNLCKITAGNAKSGRLVRLFGHFSRTGHAAHRSAQVSKCLAKSRM